MDVIKPRDVRLQGLRIDSIHDTIVVQGIPQGTDPNEVSGILANILVDAIARSERTCGTCQHCSGPAESSGTGMCSKMYCRVEYGWGCDVHYKRR